MSEERLISDGSIVWYYVTQFLFIVCGAWFVVTSDWTMAVAAVVALYATLDSVCHNWLMYGKQIVKVDEEEEQDG